jgi:hypothetical protein
MQRYTYMCPVDRFVGKSATTCPHCRKPTIWMGLNWRAPKKNDDRAWTRIQSGDWKWDHSTVSFPGRGWYEHRLVAGSREKPRSSFGRFFPLELRQRVDRLHRDRIKQAILERMTHV